MATEIINQCSIRSKLGLEGGHGAVPWGQDVSLLHPHSPALAGPKPVQAWVPVRGAAMGAEPSEPGHSLLAQNCPGLGNDFLLKMGLWELMQVPVWPFSLLLATERSSTR